MENNFKIFFITSKNTTIFEQNAIFLINKQHFKVVCNIFDQYATFVTKTYMWFSTLSAYIGNQPCLLQLYQES